MRRGERTAFSYAERWKEDIVCGYTSDKCVGLDGDGKRERQGRGRENTDSCVKGTTSAGGRALPSISGPCSCSVLRCMAEPDATLRQPSNLQTWYLLDTSRFRPPFSCFFSIYGSVPSLKTIISNPPCSFFLSIRPQQRKRRQQALNSGGIRPSDAASLSRGLVSSDPARALPRRPSEGAGGDGGGSGESVVYTGWVLFLSIFVLSPLLFLRSHLCPSPRCRGRCCCCWG